MGDDEKRSGTDRQGTRTDLITPAKVSHKSVQRTADKIGAFAGVLGRTVVEKIAAVVGASAKISRQE
jgi:hypothetical protein